jgi:glycosyltransferase involved in cell wall biosynthesis
LHLAVDLRILDRVGMEHTGLGRYALGAVNGLRAARPGWRITLESNRPELLARDAGVVVRRTRWPTRFSLGRLAWLHLGALGAGSFDGDVWWGPAFTLPSRWHGPAVVTVHDLVFRLRPDLYRTRLRARYAARATLAAARRAESVLCPSVTTADRVTGELGIDREKVAVVPWGVDDVFRAPRAGGTGDYVLFVGRWEARKGLGVLHAAIRDIAADGRPLRLVVAGGPGWRADAEVRALRDDPQVELVTDPSDERLASLYREALALAYPSSMEGFGFPVAEAMASGCPVVASDLPELRELAADAAMYFAPGEHRELADALRNVSGDSQRRRAMAERGREIAAGLTWLSCGEATARVLESAVGGGQDRAPASTRR